MVVSGSGQKDNMVTRKRFFDAAASGRSNRHIGQIMMKIELMKNPNLVSNGIVFFASWTATILAADWFGIIALSSSLFCSLSTIAIANFATRPR